jgi:uncharacterized protein HemX
MRSQQGFIGGLYAYLAIGAAVLAIAGYAAFQYQRAEAARASARVWEERAAHYLQVAGESEKEKAKLKAAAKALDTALVERDRRARALEETKRKLQGELDVIRSTLPVEDQSCLTRELPPALVERLRNP